VPYRKPSEVPAPEVLVPKFETAPVHAGHQKVRGARRGRAKVRSELSEYAVHLALPASTV